MTTPVWYVRRLRAMGPAEVVTRLRHEAVKQGWRRHMVPVGGSDSTPLPPGPRDVRCHLPPAAWRAALDGAVAEAAVDALLARADGIMDGHFEALGVVYDTAAPDWHLDPVSGRRAPDGYSFTIPYRDADLVGDIKHVWELSRHHHLTVLAAAFAVTGDPRYAERVDRDLRDWVDRNPFLSGPHWTSGIELGVRLISWVWIRRLLSAWAPVADLFERNDDLVRQVAHHHRWLRTFESAGSSANNHVIAEAAGLVASTCAFDWDRDAGATLTAATELLTRQCAEQTFPSGVNRELASEYHLFVIELVMVAITELVASGRPVPEALVERFTAMVDALAAMVDDTGRLPRQGDGDDGQALVVDGTTTSRTASVLAAARHLVGAAPWWPTAPSHLDVRSALIATVAPPLTDPARRGDRRRPDLTDAGVLLMRERDRDGSEIWCRFDTGPHGFRSIAAHAHADALSVELRHDGVDLLADPGTFAYHGDARWRRATRCTLGHNTVEVDGHDQSVAGGPFLWTTAATTTLHELRTDDDGRLTGASASHDGYARLDPPVVHRRDLDLDVTGGAGAELRITDTMSGLAGRTARIAFHLGPAVTVELATGTAELRWNGPAGPRAATIVLDPGCRWEDHRGRPDPAAGDPPLGWFAPEYGGRIPTTTLIGTGSAERITTVVRFATSDVWSDRGTGTTCRPDRSRADESRADTPRADTPRATTVAPPTRNGATP